MGAQTREVTARLIKGMPLYDGATKGLDVTLIDTPGYGDLVVDTHANSSADKVCAEVRARPGGRRSAPFLAHAGQTISLLRGWCGRWSGESRRT